MKRSYASADTAKATDRRYRTWLCAARRHGERKVAAAPSRALPAQRSGDLDGARAEQPLDAPPGAVEHSAVAEHRVRGVAHQQLGVDLVDELLRLHVGRQLSRLLRPHGGVRQPLQPAGVERQDLLLDPAGVIAELGTDGREEAAAREHATLEVQQELVAQRPQQPEALPLRAGRVEHLPVEDLL